MNQGGNYWTLFTPGIWKVLHAVLHSGVAGNPCACISGIKCPCLLRARPGGALAVGTHSAMNAISPAFGCTAGECAFIAGFIKRHPEFQDLLADPAQGHSS